ncbi:unnamed protein product [Protopolystoma xenopodis]|uniref:Uncharacterized protein n=1 Tax=Protopolystoma xenopodis TaxID=117903 RepID=A0A3S5C6L7_9PLAT|nr:unnamed protein product [Protopolystoma xenopodis]
MPTSRPNGRPLNCLSIHPPSSLTYKPSYAHSYLLYACFTSFFSTLHLHLCPALSIPTLVQPGSLQLTSSHLSSSRPSFNLFRGLRSSFCLIRYFSVCLEDLFAADHGLEGKTESLSFPSPTYSLHLPTSPHLTSPHLTSSHLISFPLPPCFGHPEGIACSLCLHTSLLYRATLGPLVQDRLNRRNQLNRLV